MNLDTWLVYALAALGLSLSPGPNGLLALTHGALHGWQRTLFTIFGGALGFVAVVALSMFGIGALLQTSLVWLTVMKWVGGAYLVWLGVQVWRSPPIGLQVGGRGEPRAGASMFRQGLLSAVTNPKAVLFFAAFLPQFIDPARSLWVQLPLLMVTAVAVDVIVMHGYAFLASRAQRWLATARARRAQNRVFGGVLMAMGASLLLVKRSAG